MRWTSIGIVMYRAHARKRWRATLRGTYFSLKKKKSEVEVMCSLWNKTRKRTSIDHPNYISYLRAVFPTNNFLCLVTTSLIRPLDFSNEFFLDERRRLARDRAKVKIRGGFHRRVALEPSTCSRGTLRSHYLMVITGVERPIGREV